MTKLPSCILLTLVAYLWLAVAPAVLAANASVQGSSVIQPGVNSQTKLRVRAIRIRPPKSSKFLFRHGFNHFKGFTPPPSTRGNVNVRDYGATGNGSTDDQTAIVNAVNAASARGAAVYFPAGNYFHSGTIYSGVQFFGDGSSSVVVGSNQLAYDIFFQGNGVGISKMVVYGEIAIQGTNFLIDQITIGSSSNNGIEVMNSSTGTISDSQISGAMNAGVYIWNSNNIQMLNDNIMSRNREYFNTNEYSVRIDGQGNQQVVNQNVTISGTSISGRLLLHNCQALTFSNNNVVYGNLDLQVIGYSTYGPDLGATISNNAINGENLNTSGATTGLLVSCTPYPTSAYVAITGNSISAFLTGLSLSGGANANVSRNTFTNIAGTAITAVTPQTNLNSSILLANNYFQYISGSGIHVDCFGGGVSIDSNGFVDICGQTPGAVIDVAYVSGTNYINIENNGWSIPPLQAQYFIYCSVPGSASNPNISGNNGGLVPNYLAP